MQEALDYLEELMEEDESDVSDVAQALFIEPPDFDGNVSGEDDAEEDCGGIPDNVCAAQLRSNCEIVLRSGRRMHQFGDEPDELGGWFRISNYNRILLIFFLIY